MEGLYLQTKNGPIPIDPDMVKKYHLQEGTTSPYTGFPIVGHSGQKPMGIHKETLDYGLDERTEEEKRKADQNAIPRSGNNIELNTSEIIDFGQGVDSSNN